MSEKIDDPDRMKTSDDEELPPSTSAREVEFSFTPSDENRQSRTASDDLTPSLARLPSASLNIEQSVETESVRKATRSSSLSREEPLEPAVTVPSQSSARKRSRSTESVVTHGSEAEPSTSGSGSQGESLNSSPRVKRARTSYVAPLDSGLTFKFEVHLHEQGILSRMFRVGSQETPQPTPGLRPPSDEQNRESAPQSGGDEHRQPEAMEIDQRSGQEPPDPLPSFPLVTPVTEVEESMPIPTASVPQSEPSEKPARFLPGTIVTGQSGKKHSRCRSDRAEKEHQIRKALRKALKDAQRAGRSGKGPLKSVSLKTPDEAFKCITVSGNEPVKLDPDSGSSTTVTNLSSKGTGDTCRQCEARSASAPSPPSTAVQSSSRSLPTGSAAGPEEPDSHKTLLRHQCKKISEEVLKLINLFSPYVPGSGPAIPDEFDPLSRLQTYRSADDTAESEESSSDSSSTWSSDDDTVSTDKDDEMESQSMSGSQSKS